MKAVVRLEGVTAYVLTSPPPSSAAELEEVEQSNLSVTSLRGHQPQPAEQ
jgi:hypothetical protein